MVYVVARAVAEGWLVTSAMILEPLVDATAAAVLVANSTAVVDTACVNIAVVVAGAMSTTADDAGIGVTLVSPLIVDPTLLSAVV